MLYVFKSRAAADLIMLEPHGRRVLQIIGKDPAPKGIVLPEQMAAAVAALEAAVAQAEAERAAAAAADPDAPEHPDAVSLRQRAAPFIAMLKLCEKAGKDIVWGV